MEGKFNKISDINLVSLSERELHRKQITSEQEIEKANIVIEQIKTIVDGELDRLYAKIKRYFNDLINDGDSVFSGSGMTFYRNGIIEVEVIVNERVYPKIFFTTLTKSFYGKIIKKFDVTEDDLNMILPSIASEVFSRDISYVILKQ